MALESRKNAAQKRCVKASVAQSGARAAKVKRRRAQGQTKQTPNERPPSAIGGREIRSAPRPTSGARFDGTAVFDVAGLWRPGRGRESSLECARYRPGKGDRVSRGR